MLCVFFELLLELLFELVVHEVPEGAPLRFFFLVSLAGLRVEEGGRTSHGVVVFGGVGNGDVLLL